MPADYVDCFQLARVDSGIGSMLPLFLGHNELGFGDVSSMAHVKYVPNPTLEECIRWRAAFPNGR